MTSGRHLIDLAGTQGASVDRWLRLFNSVTLCRKRLRWKERPLHGCRITHQSTGAAQEAAQPGDFKRYVS
jgi:hypothetical protein